MITYIHVHFRGEIQKVQYSIFTQITRDKSVSK